MDNSFFDFLGSILINISMLTNINVRLIGNVFGFIALMTFLNIFFNETGISKLQSSQSNFFHFVFLSTGSSVFIFAFSCLIFARTFFLPDIYGKQIYENKEIGYRISIPGNWNIEKNGKMLGDIGFEGIFFEDKVNIFSQDRSCQILIGKTITTISQPSDYKKEIKSNNKLISRIYTSPYGYDLFSTTERIIATGNFETAYFAIYSKCNTFLFNQIVSSLKSISL